MRYSTSVPTAQVGNTAGDLLSAPWVGAADLVFHAIATGFRALRFMPPHDRSRRGTGVLLASVRQHHVVTKGCSSTCPILECEHSARWLLGFADVCCCNPSLAPCFGRLGDMFFPGSYDTINKALYPSPRNIGLLVSAPPSTPLVDTYKLELKTCWHAVARVLRETTSTTNTCHPNDGIATALVLNCGLIKMQLAILLH